MLVIGGASLDTVVQLEHLPEPRPGTIFSRGSREVVGGTGAGKALNLRRLGLDVRLHLVLGADEAGRKVRDLLDANGVATLIDEYPGSTERHINLMAPDGARISIYATYAPAQPTIDWPRLEAALVDADVVCLNIIDYCRRLIPALEATGKPIWCDIHDWDGTDPYHLDFVTAADTLFMSSDRLPDYRGLMEKLHGAGKRLVVCTHGRDGASALDAEGHWIDIPIAEGFTPRDANGAGDAFMAGTLYGLLNGRTLEHSLRMGAVTAGMCVESTELFSDSLSPASLDAALARARAVDSFTGHKEDPPMAATSDPLQRGRVAPDFALPGTDGRTWSYADAAGPNGLVVAFICNHCPYVKAVVDRIVRDAGALAAAGVGMVAINSNDVVAFPEDSFERMQAFAREHGFTFPYLHDETQQVARDYGAMCTPDFFGFDRGRKLQYRGRLDASGRQPAAPDTRRELLEAMLEVARTGHGPEVQHASIGCSIKWKGQPGR